MAKGQVVVVANQKGGVGKSTTVYALMDEFAETLGLKILVIDYDPQGTLTSLLDIDQAVLAECRKEGSICNMFERKEVNIIEYSDKIDFIPSDDALNDSFYSSKPGKELMLQKYVDKVRGDYDLIFIDTKPDLQAPIISAILAADIIVNTIATGGIEEDATIKFYNKLDEIVDLYNKKILKVFVIPTMLDTSRDAKDALYSIKVNLPDLYSKRYAALVNVPLEILKPIPRRAVFKNATGVKVSIRKYIEEFDTGKKDVLLDLEQIAKKIWGEVKQNG
ncbi:chromosome partitioning protein, ATPase ParA (plasmid) [Sulfuricurvum kujiense DSM 16994]|uniref:Chromosome partitioning protein, ATPase ParA n=1 Tax=Sulfuricurvum kujiense (strain ATCC BAA-921 / DSM 16994 / JCM 11577 / YK-1) TaxID=709032 RepID=E4U3R9_SULKY|nr:ParA family protein [Sulfuricurvum kujiense]ADR35335.1 chromosome partitioning protein, ATPase ParA [Sulfuricurvum kujiense DSM 16994]